MIALVLLLIMAASEAQQVVKLDVICDGEYPEEQVYRIISPLLGSTLSRYAVRKAVREIYALGRFSQVMVDKAELPGGVKLTFILKVKEAIRKIGFEGNHNISSARLYAVLRSKEGSEFDEGIVRRDVERIKSLYRREGFFRCRVDYRVEKEDKEVSITFLIEEGERGKIGRIALVGNEAFDSDTLLKRAGLREGMPYSERALREGLRRIEEFYVENGYLAVKAEKARESFFPTLNAVNIQIRIEEGPLVEVSFLGNDHIPSKELKKSILLYRAREVSDFVLRRSALDIETIYRRRGFYNAKCSYRVRRVKDRVFVTFIVSEGRRLRIKRIEFVGNEAFTDEELKKQISTKEAGWWPPWRRGKGIYDEERFEVDLKALGIFYRRNGFLDVEIGEPKVEVKEDGIYITVRVREGRRYRVRGVVIEGNRVLSDEELLPRLSVRPGKPLNEEELTADRTYIRSRYADLGYIYAQVEPRYDPKTGVVTYHVREGVRVRVGRITFSGNERTKESLLRREMALKEGDVLRASKLAESRVNLFRLGIFNSIRFELKGTEGESEVVDLMVILRERNSGSINLRGGYSPAEGVRATLELSHRNLFGMARRFSSKLRVGTLGGRYEILYVEPWLFNTRTQGMVRLFREDMEAQRDVLATGCIVGITRKIKKANDLSLQYRYQILSGPDFETSISSLGTVFQRDTRDSFLDPSKGWLNELSVEYAGGFLRGENSFFKLSGALRNYRKLVGDKRRYRLVLAWALRAGYARGLRATKRIILFERFERDGSTMLRGHRERVRGDVMLIGNVELRSWIYRFIGGTLFLDLGNVWGDVGDVSLDSVKVDLGAGLRFDTPIGPVRIDYGYPLDRGDDVGMPGEIWISLGNAF